MNSPEIFYFSFHLSTDAFIFQVDLNTHSRYVLYISSSFLRTAVAEDKYHAIKSIQLVVRDPMMLRISFTFPCASPSIRVNP